VPEEVHESFPSTAQILQKQSPALSQISYDRPVAAAAFKIELVLREPLSARVHKLRFATHPPFRWAAGQYLVVLPRDERGLPIPYSIASAYDAKLPGEFEIAAAFRGADFIDELVLGDELEAQGPMGSFTWQSSPRPAALLVGVGTGIAPLRALIQEELMRRTETRLVLLAGHRAPEDVLFHSEFVRLAESEPRFQFIPTLTGGAAHWLGRRGRVQTQLEEAVRSLGSLDDYVCGRLDMVDEVVSALRSLGVAEPRIRSEGY
jgi:NAD(P)H-flavin reductase